MTRVSPSIAERCRIFSNTVQDDNDANFRRMYYQDGVTQTASGIPVPVNHTRKEAHTNQNGQYFPQHDQTESSMKLSRENEIQRIQRKLRARWETPLNTNRLLHTEHHEDPNLFRHTTAGCFEVYNSINSCNENKHSLDTATMNFSAEDITTTADETDESKV